MPRISFEQVTKSFGHTQVLRDFSATVEDGEFLVLLGPSGCGKSTLLRMIAGLTDVTSGNIRFDSETINDWDVLRRNVAFVFQSYALYPQMTVRENIAFPLIMQQFRSWHHLPVVGSVVRRRLMRSPGIADKISAIAAQLELTALLERRPSKLSGGQRQRVALGRSLVRNPSAYLLDEPLSNLDAKLRTQMRGDITRLHRTVGKTFVYVTHDQVEAMTMATTIIVMNDGVIQQIGSPDDIYDRPENTFVATFVGSPPMNLIDGRGIQQHPGMLGDAFLPANDFVGALVGGIRPESLRVGPPASGGMPATIDVVERVGAETLIGCRLNQSGDAEGATPLVFARVPASFAFQAGSACSLCADPGSMSWFDRSGGKRIELPIEAEASRLA